MAKVKAESPIYVYPAIFTPEPEGGYFIHFPDIENCFTSGKDIKDGMIEEVIEVNEVKEVNDDTLPPA